MSRRNSLESKQRRRYDRAKRKHSVADKMNPNRPGSLAAFLAAVILACKGGQNGNW